MNKIIDSLLEYNNGDWEETTDDIKMLYQIALSPYKIKKL